MQVQENDDIFYELAKEELPQRIEKLHALLEAQGDFSEVEKAQLEELMRTAHNLKAIGGYTELPAVAIFSHEIESVFVSLINDEVERDEFFIEWTDGVKNQLALWMEQLECGDFNLIQQFSQKVGAMVYSIETLSGILKECTLLVIETSSLKLAYVKSAEKYMGKVVVMGSFQEALSYIKHYSDEKVVVTSDILDEKKFLLKLIVSFMEKSNNTPLLVLENHPLPAKYRQMLLQEEHLDFIVNHPISIEAFDNALALIAGNRYINKTIKLGKNSEILSYINSLAPLPDSINELNRLRTDSEATLKDVSDVITKDPMLSSRILQIVGSAAMGLSGHVTSVHQAVTLLGKERVLALAMQTNMSNALHLDLSPYGIDEHRFYEIAIKRMNLMTYWIMRVALSKVGLLSTAALLSNIGEIVIAKAILKSGKRERFLKLIEQKGVEKAELEMIKQSAESVTVDLLTYWQIDPEIINALRYCNNPSSAPKELGLEALSLFAINQIISPTSSKIDARVVERMASEISMQDANPKAFRLALEKIGFTANGIVE